MTDYEKHINKQINKVFKGCQYKHIDNINPVQSLFLEPYHAYLDYSDFPSIRNKLFQKSDSKKR